MIRCVILDDEPLALNILKEYVAKAQDIELVLATTDAFAALKLVQDGSIDLIFLDIQMPELTGIQFMKIMNGKCKVVLTTAYEEYALEAFDHDVVDYLLKPFSLERFMIAVNKAKERITTAVAPVVAPTRPDFIFVKSEYKMLKIDLKNILYFESLRDYVAIHTAETKVMTLQSLRSFEEALDERQFMRIHKSYIIAIDKISSIERKRVVINGVYLPVGDTYLDDFLARVVSPK